MPLMLLSLVYNSNMASAALALAGFSSTDPAEFSSGQIWKILVQASFYMCVCTCMCVRYSEELVGGVTRYHGRPTTTSHWLQAKT